MGLACSKTEASEVNSLAHHQWKMRTTEEVTASTAKPRKQDVEAACLAFRGRPAPKSLLTRVLAAMLRLSGAMKQMEFVFAINARAAKLR
mmetsp:Transcript_94709/g.282859  ORF Transcript_94709/g.282859 Transcript_94709/m.282859 type:complete len:90 (-) Transcript_94709:847-1116(-)